MAEDIERGVIIQICKLQMIDSYRLIKAGLVINLQSKRYTCSFFITPNQFFIAVILKIRSKLIYHIGKIYLVSMGQTFQNSSFQQDQSSKISFQCGEKLIQLPYRSDRHYKQVQKKFKSLWNTLQQGFIEYIIFIIFIWMAKSQLILLLTFLSLISLTTSALGTVCSTFCSASGCNGWTMMDCNNQCYSGWTYSSIISTCDISNSSGTNKTVMAYSDDAGGDISVSDDLGTGCSVSGNTYYYGKYTSSQTVTVQLTIGTYIPHYAFDMYFNLILVDIQAGGGSKWDNNPKLDATLVNATNSTNDQKITKTLSLNSGSNGPVNQGKNECGTNNDDRYFRLVYQTYKHQETGIPITINLKFTNSQNNAVWNIREVIFVAYICNEYCLTCFNKTISQCYSCDYTQGYMLSGTTCATSCLSGYGYTFDPAVCVLCSSYCTTCYNLADNCTACKSSSGSASFLQYNTTTFYYQCVVKCSGAFFGNTTTRICDPCNSNCTGCITNANRCTSCVLNYGWYNYTCNMPCLNGFYFTNGTNNCSACPSVCATCTDNVTCTLCKTSSPVSYLHNAFCYTTCPDGNFGTTNSTGANICMPCSSFCAVCTGNPSPCSKCNNGSFLYAGVCSSTCPPLYIAYLATNQCLKCDDICVDLTISLSFPTSTNSELYIDMTYSLDLDFTTFNWKTFQTVSISNNDINNFDLTYSITGTNSYRIIVKPKGFIFLYNETVTVTTEEPPNTIDTSASSIPFKTSNYLKTATTNWFLLQPPDLTDIQNQVIQGFASVNNVLSNATTTPFIAQIKKSGVFALAFSGAHITSCTIFVNSIPPQNLYEGARFWGLSTFYDVPSWQQSSGHPNNVFGSQLYNLTLNQRRLFDLQTLPWRYQRTGLTSFFIYDVYIPIFLISVVWILALVGKILRKYYKSLKDYEQKFFTILHKIHQFTILYVTTAMILEWMYFDAASAERWISLLVCIAFTIYFVGYHLYVYYDMIRYPEAMIGNQKYEKYVTRYSTFLKNVRYEEYDMNQPWSWRHWFRPYNYHILSYYKKFCMIITFPLFYDSPKWSAGVMTILQLLQIIRFLLTRPYQARWRNIYRFSLQFFLLVLFTVVYVNCFMMDQIVLNGSDVLYYVTVYYNLGWLGFVMIWLFNLGFVVLMVVDVVQGFRKTSREMMDQARRNYYYGKIIDYQKEFDKVPLGLMNRWVKLGNLNDRRQSQLPDINVRLEYYKLIRHKQYYDVDVLKAVQLFMNTDFNYHKENNTTPGKLIRKKVKLSREVSPPLHRLIDHLYNTYAKKDTQALIIKTFMMVKQKEFKAGDRIPLLPQAMFQKLQLQNFAGDKEMVSVKQRLAGFPINAHDLQSI